MKKEQTYYAENRDFCFSFGNRIVFVLIVIVGIILAKQGMKIGECLIYSLIGRIGYVLITRYEVKNMYWISTIVIAPVLLLATSYVLEYFF